ncbi:hypothetical protein HDU97_002477 [Phlyctochytrium planicorne]|nr:hypothetical protein HDU97_002477 [Phlyctochytrium planicorne]
MNGSSSTPKITAFRVIGIIFFAVAIITITLSIAIPDNEQERTDGHQNIVSAGQHRLRKPLAASKPTFNSTTDILASIRNHIDVQKSLLGNYGDKADASLRKQILEEQEEITRLLALGADQIAVDSKKNINALKAAKVGPSGVASDQFKYELEPNVGQARVDFQKSKVPIPRQIWTFWDSGNPPLFVRECIEGWRRYNPEYNITVISHDTISKYIKTPPPANLNGMFNRFMADWVRLAVVSERGGIWMDASMILTGSMDYILRKQEKYHFESFGYFLRVYTTNFTIPVFESWFFASAPQGAWVSAWFSEFNKIFANFNMEDKYLEYLESIYGQKGYERILQGNNMPEYLKIHMASQKVLTMDNIKPPYAEEAEKTPYLIMDETGFDDWAAAEMLVKPWNEKKHPIPWIFKLRGGVRSSMMEITGSKKEMIHHSSVYSRFVKRTNETVKQLAKMKPIEGLKPLKPGSKDEADHDTVPTGKTKKLDNKNGEKCDCSKVGEDDHDHEKHDMEMMEMEMKHHR